MRVIIAESLPRPVKRVPRPQAASCCCATAAHRQSDGRGRTRRASATTENAGRALARFPASGPPDPFKACDLQVRADLREGGTWLIPRDIHLDEGRLMVSVTFLPEKSIRSV